MHSIKSHTSIFYKNNSKVNIHFKNSKSQNNYNISYSKTEFPNSSTMFSSINSIITQNKENNLHTLSNNIDKRNIKTKFMLNLCNGTFYPRTLRSKNYLKEIKSVLPPLITSNNYISPNSELQESIDNFNLIYQNKGSDLSKNIEKINEGKYDNQFTFNIFKNNRINLDESKYINKIFKKNKKENYFIKFKGTSEYESPLNSLMTLKVNKSIIQKISEDINNYQYQTFATIINNHQKDKIKLCMMPKPLVKGIQYHLNIDNKSNNNTNNKKKFQIKYFYCKYIPQSNNWNPNSRMEASFTPYFNGIFLYGGLQTQDYSDLWFFNLENKRYTWERKILKNENNFNSRSAHTTVLFNDCLYIYGGNINLKKLKNQLEDILVYNIRTKT